MRTCSALFLLACLTLAGCPDGRPQRYQLSGKITFDGKPVPAGWIIFTPESGPGASANIENGRYETPPGFGSIGGMHTIEVVAFGASVAPKSNNPSDTSATQKVMFKYTGKKEIPKGAADWPIEISSEDKGVELNPK